MAAGGSQFPLSEEINGCPSSYTLKRTASESTLGKIVAPKKETFAFPFGVFSLVCREQTSRYWLLG